ncbi:MAG: tetratricopeptide repeat protein [Sulfurisoma sp.]|nr:tetratricopeptide repeat protein [Sulfurisoma sp.]
MLETTGAQAAFETGFAAYRQGRYAEALGHYRAVMAQSPAWFEPHWHAGVCCHQLRRYAEALDCYSRAMALNAEHAQVGYHHAKALKDAGDLDAALAAYRQALDLKPGDPEMLYSQGLLYLLRGEWRQGWPGYELRFAGSDRAATEHRPRTGLLRWQGGAVPEGSGIVVYAEQGMGDSIQCVRYAAALRQRFSRVRFSVQIPLVGLFQANAGYGVDVVPRVAGPIDESGHTHWIDMMSLPAVLNTTPDTVPPAPYLVACPERAEYWRGRLAKETRPRIGVVWQGGKLTHAPARDMPFGFIAPLLEHVDIAWISLQKDMEFAGNAALIDWMPEVRDFADTAALVSVLDGVVAVDTAVAHLAGALGRPVWLLNRHESEWRWMHGRTTTPWYPSMRILTQPEPGDWGAVIAAVSSALRPLAMGSPAREPEAVAAMAFARGVQDHMAGRTAGAEVAYREALATRPGHAMAWYNLGIVLQACEREEAAREAYRSAIAADPKHREARLNLAASLSAEGQASAARRVLEALLELAPDWGPPYNNLATLMQDMDEHEHALALLQRVSALSPGLPQPRSNLLMELQYHPRASAATLRAAAADWGAWAMAQAGDERPRPTPNPVRDANGAIRALRVGYVSADFCMHPVGLFLKAVLAAHNPAQVLPFAYGNGAASDEVTQEIQATLHRFHAGPAGWIDARSLDDAALAERIRADGIDLLVDLSGHTGKTRLPMFARRPAPVQVSWLGYFATTGLPAMDAVILDPWHAPEGAEAQFTEAIIRLPNNRFCYQPVPFAPAVSPAPTFPRGYITFGSFNNTAKLNDTVLDTWARILQVVPDSRLILKWRTFADGPYREHIRQYFTGRGIAQERIELRPASPHRELLEQYADIDIALDPFPFSGGHTSCEALWMGVPVITWPRERVVSRQTWSFLANIGLTELVVDSAGDYVAKAVTLAGDRARLGELRQNLRPRMAASPLCDVSGFIRHLEAAYLGLWLRITGETLLLGAQSSEPEAAARGTRAEQFHQDALAAWQSNDPATAAERLRAAIALDPGVAAYHANLGVMLKSLGWLDERIACYRQAIALAPNEATYHANLAAALNQAGRHAEGELAGCEATRLDPRRPESWFNLGSSLAGQEQWEAAARAYDQAATLRPDWPDAPRAAGDAWRAAGDWALAAQRFHAAWQHLPAQASHADRAGLLQALGQALERCYRHADAEACYRQALELTPDRAALLTDLGNALKAQGRLDEALIRYRRVLELEPESAGGHCNPGTVAQAQGDYDTAIDCYRRALSLDPGLVPVWGNLGNCLTYSPRHGPAEVLAAFREFDARVARPLIDRRPHANERAPDRRLRVGYVSPDFRRHAVAYFALPLLENHTQAVEVFCYYNHRQQDEWTARFKAASQHWRDCANLTDEALAARIRADGIDILVDLAGHTENNRLLVFARKPAPVQVTWMGYVTTTGMGAMDWRVTHTAADPAGSEDDYSERLWRLPGAMWCYRPLSDMPTVSPAPTFRNGHVTFGSFNRYSKNSSMVLEAWAQILGRVPDSRLLICVPEGQVRQGMARFFAERDIAPQRIQAFAKVDHPTFWALHGEVDIALDPFPFGGGTTTCETLWLGVPVVTCTGKTGGDFAPRFASRMGYAFLNNIGVPELAVESVADYIETAVALASDRNRLAELRQSLRSRMAAAPLTDEGRFAREMEAAYRGMWGNVPHPRSPAQHSPDRPEQLLFR